MQNRNNWLDAVEGIEGTTEMTLSLYHYMLRHEGEIRLLSNGIEGAEMRPKFVKKYARLYLLRHAREKPWKVASVALVIFESRKYKRRLGVRRLMHLIPIDTKIELDSKRFYNRSCSEPYQVEIQGCLGGEENYLLAFAGPEARKSWVSKINSAMIEALDSLKPTPRTSQRVNWVSNKVLVGDFERLEPSGSLTTSSGASEAVPMISVLHDIQSELDDKDAYCHQDLSSPAENYELPSLFTVNPPGSPVPMAISSIMN
eukprot:CAMPEP_0184482802 /NCGR_PEP_ID=MMETSP0113_2-20130426/4399_1 /TAXON_ID=91329 /ORGANISM="Norrisiella sphaerica, Strain BC52" /LENGTH=257 /DNA_ID=CAMNT_0026862787 /DNA_START=232 /DNA_END=1005 /DNA_ORIENTATION=+